MMATMNRDPARFPRKVTTQWINIFVHGRRLWSAAVVVNCNTHVSHTKIRSLSMSPQLYHTMKEPVQSSAPVNKIMHKP